MMSLTGYLMYRPAIIIQARMASTRFPGKVMADLNGKPMLHRIIDRLKESKAFPTVCVATPDVEIARYCAMNDLAPHYIGEPEDVLLRLTNAAHFYNFNPIARITGDCPLIDPWLIDRMFQEVNVRYDYISNVVVRTFPRGTDVEILHEDVLQWLNRHTEELRHREHVTLWLRENFDKVSALSVENEVDYSHYEWRVDYPDDLEYIRGIYKACGPLASWQAVVEYMGEHVSDTIRTRCATGDDCPTDAIHDECAATGPVSKEPGWYERRLDEEAPGEESVGETG